MILQHFVFPKEDICTKESLYYKKDFENVRMTSNGFELDEEGECSFYTYFNSFSLEKWKKYTVAKNLFLELELYGKGTVTIWNAFLQEGKVTKVKGTEIVYDCRMEMDLSAEKKIKIAIPDSWEKGIVYMTIRSTKKSLFYQGAFCCEEESVHPVKIAAGICTFRREPFVEKTVSNLKKCFLHNEKSRLYNNLHVYVSDNGSTLDLEVMNTEGVTCVYNKNAGGTGGFTRCLLEALKDQEKEQYTHFLFMDDDIVLDPEVFYRTYVMLCMVKDSMKEVAIGGGLLRMDIPEIQHTSGDLWDVDRVKSPWAGLDLSEERDLLKNEVEVSGTFNGWWYCLMPFSKAVKDNLPLPIFIHVDDVEYGLRYKGEMIHMNGIGVWHEAFDNRKSSSMEYYDMRNLLIVNAIHNPEYDWKMARKRIWNHLVLQTLKYRYEDVTLTMRGVEDFCRGIEFLKRKDPVELHQEIMRQGYLWQDQTNQLDRFDERWKENKTTKDSLSENRICKWKLLLGNGWFFPGKRKVQCIPMGAAVTELYRVKKVLFYDPDTGKGFFTSRKYAMLWKLFKTRMQLTDLLQRDYERAVKSYQTRYQEITSQEFWEKYLGLEEEK